MAFKLHTRGVPATPPLVMLPTTASETYTIGEALKLSSGAVTAAAGTDTATYICNEAYSAPASGNRSVSCYRIMPDMIFETTNSASLNSLNIGDKVTIAAGGLQVTATTTGGVAEIIDKTTGTGTGNKTLVKF